MSVPGFFGEASVYANRGRYRVLAASRGNDAGWNEVVPAMPKGCFCFGDSLQCCGAIERVCSQQGSFGGGWGGLQCSESQECTEVERACGGSGGGGYGEWTPGGGGGGGGDEWNPPPPDRCEEPMNVDLMGNLARTDCDIRMSPADDGSGDYMVRTCGTGEPAITFSPKAEFLRDTMPCAFQAIQAHEMQHQQDLGDLCQQFKQCVDNASSGGRIGRDAFFACRNQYQDGFGQMCRQTERNAYQASIDSMTTSLSNPSCYPELDALTREIDYAKCLQRCPPNCANPRYCSFDWFRCKGEKNVIPPWSAA
jgi:hypothetical protein